MSLRFLYVLILLLTIHSSYATSEIPTVTLLKELNIDNGLSHNGVSCMYKDSRGYIWIGTYDGLNRYNGHSIKSYKNRVGEHLFQNNRIRTITEDNRGRLWLGTDMGVTIFDYSSEQFIPIETDGYLSSLTIKTILFYPDQEEMLCFAESGYIYTYNLDGKEIKRNSDLSNLTINRAIAMDAQRSIVLTFRGLMIYNRRSNSIEQIEGQKIKSVNDLIPTSESGVYMVAYGQGFREVKLTREHGVFKLEYVGPAMLRNMQFQKIAIDHRDNIWLGSAKDGVVYSSDYQSVEEGAKYTLENRRVSNFLFDNDLLYVSTFDRGVDCLTTQPAAFNVVGDDGTFKQVQVIPYKGSRIIARSNLDLAVVDLDSGEISDSPFKLSEDICSSQKVIFNDNDGFRWIAYKGDDGATRLVKIDQNDRVIPIADRQLQFATIGNDPNIFPFEACVDHRGDIWIGYQNNLYRVVLNEQRDRVMEVEWLTENPLFEGHKSTSKIRVIYSDPKDGSLWVGTTLEGLYHLYLDDGKSLKEISIESYDYTPEQEGSLSSNFVSSIFRSSKGVLYIGTEQGGLCIADQSGDQIRFDVVSEKEGLSNNVVKSIVEDREGNIWVGTNIGLNMLPKGESAKIRLFFNENGLPKNDFWLYSFMCDDGRLVLSTVDGLCYFDPTKIDSRSSQPKLYFDRLRIFNDDILPGVEYDQRVILNRRLTDGDEIKLRYNENHISIKVDAIFDHHSSENTIYYQLLPGSNNWIAIDARDGVITLAKIESGNYTLRIGAADQSGAIVCESELKIVIAPPFWRSGFAYFIYFSMFISWFIVVLTVILKFQSLNYRLKIESIEKVNSENRLKYLSNVSHELKTPLSLILAPLAVLQERFNTEREVNKKLETIKRQSKKMLEIIDLTHGVELNDLKMMRLTPSKINFDGVVEYLISDFEFMAEYDNKIFKVERVASSPIDVVADLGMLEKIISNIISNAFKHTLAGDIVTFKYWIEDQNLIFQVEDTGCGIDQEDLPKIFERFFQAKRSSGANLGGIGIGLTLTKRLVELHNGEIRVESEVDQGTTFTITLPSASVGSNEIVQEQPKDGSSELIEDMDFAEIIIQSEYSSSLIYLVEDNSELRNLLEEVTGRYFKVRSFANAMLMFDALESEWPDLIVSDVMMPEIDGYELCHRVKNNIQTSHIPVILLTACNTVDQKIKGLNSGADAYIPKPFYPKHLITRIETLLNSRQILRERFQIGIPLVMGRNSDTSAKDNEFMASLYELFNQQLDNEEINLDETAKAMGQNRSIFFKKIKSITNRSPYELLKEYRLQRATEFLTSGEYNVNEVCVMVGFKDRSHFSRLFKERYGVAPSKYVKSI